MYSLTFVPASQVYRLRLGRAVRTGVLRQGTYTVQARGCALCVAPSIFVKRPCSLRLVDFVGRGRCRLQEAVGL